MNHWDAGYLAAAPFFLTNVAYKRLRHGKYRKSLPGMFGANLPSVPLPPHKHRIWLHSVSVGETMGAGAVFRRLKETFPEWQFISTTTTETGQEQAARSLRLADYRDYAPVDLSWKVRRFLDAYNPSAFLLFETEIWPNILGECARRKIPVFLVNGKLSDRSARGYRLMRPVLQPAFRAFDTFYMQSEEDAERMRRITPTGSRLVVTGNVKFDNLPGPLTESERRELRLHWGVGGDDLLIMGGSTHPSEEKLIYFAFLHVKEAVPNARLVLAPRHPERFRAVESELRGLGAKVHRLKSGEPSGDPEEILLLDQMGVLGHCFGAADIALLGGSWNPIGGHNLLEPASHGIPVIHGPAMHAQREIMRIMRAHHACIEADSLRVGDVLQRLALDHEERFLEGQRCHMAAEENRGAAGRIVDDLGRLLA